MRRVFCLLLLIPAIGFADEVHLKGGAVFSGRIVEQTETMVSVDIGDGVVGLPMSRVERIEKKRSALDEYDERAARLRADDADGWRSLGRWASLQGLSAQSRQAYENVLAVEPEDPQARQGLGYVLVDGRWLTEEEGYGALGYVKYDGEWMTPADAEMAQAETEAEQARLEEAEQRAAEADLAAQEAEARAQEAEQRAREAESSQGWNEPIYWGAWGYGVTYWPAPPRASQLPAYRPPPGSVPPGRVPR